jgi:hypothetical protein
MNDEFVQMNVPDLPLGPGPSEVAEAIHRRLVQVRAIVSLMAAAPGSKAVLPDDTAESAAWAARDLPRPGRRTGRRVAQDG